MNEYILPLQSIAKSDIQRCGGKAFSLGELSRAGLRVPPGFCLAAESLDYLTSANQLKQPIDEIISQLDFEDFNGVDEKCADIRALITEADIPGDLEQGIVDHYEKLVDDLNRYVAVRSSVAVKNTPISSFPGMMDTYHYVLGIEDVLRKIKECWASLWTSRAAYSRHQKKIEHHLGIIAPVVQLMVNSDTAGVLFTANPITKSTDELVIEANWGLGESVVSGKSMNDFYVLNKKDLSVKQQKIAQKTIMVTMDEGKGSGRIEQTIPAEQATVPTLTEPELILLGETGKRIETHFGYWADIEWAYQDGDLYILQTRKIRDVE